MKRREILERKNGTIRENPSHGEIIDKYAKAKEAITTLSAYYGSDDWRKGYADDEAGLLPKYSSRKSTLASYVQL